MEHWSNIGHYYGEPHGYYQLYGNGNQRFWLYGISRNHRYGQCAAGSQCRHTTNHLFWSKRHANSIGWRHISMEYGSNISYHYGKPHFHQQLYGNGYQHSRLYGNCCNYRYGERLAGSRCRRSANHLQRTERYTYCRRRRHLFVEQWLNKCHDYGEPYCYYQLYCNSNQCQRMYGIGYHYGNG